MKILSWLISVAVLLAGCVAPAPPGYVPVRSATARVEAYGFSVLPPAGDGWYETKNNYGVIFGKRIPPITSYHAGISVSRVPDLKDRQAFYDFAHKKLTEGSDSYRYKLIRNDVTEYEKNGLLVAEGRVDFDDTGAVNLGNNDALQTRTATIIAWDPKDPERVVAEWYSWRGLNFDETTFARDAKHFLDSLQRTTVK